MLANIFTFIDFKQLDKHTVTDVFSSQYYDNQSL